MCIRDRNNTDPNFDAFLMNGIGLNGSVQGGTAEMTISEVTLETAMVTIIKGDVDRNGVVDFFDIQPFIDVLSASGDQAEADADCDGDVDFFHIQPFINILSGVPPVSP